MMWKKQISDLLKKMGKIFYDIIPPETGDVRIKSDNFKKSIVKIAAFGLIAAVSWAGISSVYNTLAYFNDTEESKSNDFTAGALDFELSSTQIFSNMSLSTSTPATGTISITNLYNVPQYKVKTVNPSGALCGYLNLEAKLDGVVKYSGKLTDFDYGPTIFESPDDWFFTLTLPSNATDTVVGETCSFNFSFYGSQIRNSLPFGQGFSDTEQASSSIKANMCFDSRTSSCDYWKNNPNIYKPYLPQKLGNEIIDTVSKANNVLKSSCGDCGCGCDNTMRTKLKGQLLTMKFNVAHYGIGDYIPESTSSSLNQIIEEADNLLKQIPAPDNSVLEAMKNLLAGLNNNLTIKVCTDTGVRVLIPNGGEQWWVGKYYDLTWITKNLNCPNNLVQISIWYSKDSGNTWGNIATGTDNDGVYNWRIPLYLENNTYYTVSDKARIKVVAVCTENLMVAGWDISDHDFCPPIDPSLLTPEELELAKSLGLIPEEIVSEQSTTTENQITDATSSEPIVMGGGSVSVPIPTESDPAADPLSSGTGQGSVIETTTTTAETPTTTEEAATTTDQGGIIDTINNAIDVVAPDSTTSEATATTTESIETPVIEQAPPVEEQPVIVTEIIPADPVPPLAE